MFDEYETQMVINTRYTPTEWHTADARGWKAVVIQIVAGRLHKVTECVILYRQVQLSALLIS